MAALEEEYADFKQDYEIKKRQFINRLEEHKDAQKFLFE